MIHRTLTGALKTASDFSSLISWKPSGRWQQTLAKSIEITGKALHSGKISNVKLWPTFAGQGRCFEFRSNLIPASINFVEDSPLCTTLCKDGHKIRTVEHLLSALEATGVHNCRIEIESSDSNDQDVEVPILDGSAKEWVEAIEQAGIHVCADRDGNGCEKMTPHLNEPVHVWKNDSFIAAFPSSKVQITYGIDFPQVSAIGCQWYSSTLFDENVYVKQIATARTFCVYEEIEQMRSLGLIKGGSMENAIVCSATKGWLNPPLRFHDEPCRHKVLDLIGDFSLFAWCGNQGLPVAHIVAYKGGHALHTDFVRRLSGLLQKG